MKVKTKHHYEVLGFVQDCPRNYMQKLLSLGFIPGEKFYVSKKALFGNPYHIIIKSFSVSLRQSELDFIEVKSI